ncbi:hypothetical protein E1267_25510 [Nonomuraea longispora]|uniref:Uncharacterized protein n=1 Tax=Nonomuraea longispora TaxID=1848320 RepID=A0A4V2XJR2_9ACTN|nr:hypothetical protein [Nonomuraea longispora]TDC03686.1 hypothetical protein E1267_25510 [Nonomuraea longispora]
MSNLPGTWQLDLKTPIGTLHVEYRFTTTSDGFAGDASSRNETVPLSGIAAADTETGERVTWQQSVTKPMRLNLDFDVVIEGDTMTGHARAGRLPRTPISGHRVAP